MRKKPNPDTPFIICHLWLIMAVLGVIAENNFLIIGSFILVGLWSFTWIKLRKKPVIK